MSRIGQMRDFVDFLQDSGSADASGQHIENFDGAAFMENVAGEFRQVGGGEVVRGKQMQEQTTHLFTCWWFEGVTTDMKLRDSDSVVYGIVRADRIPNGLNYQLAVQVKAN